MGLFRCRQLDQKSRRILAVGNLCLASGLIFSHIAEGFGHRHPAIYDDLRFLLMGCACGLLLWSARRAQGFSSRH
jgi:hypothetical protein